MDLRLTLGLAAILASASAQADAPTPVRITPTAQARAAAAPAPVAAPPPRLPFQAPVVGPANPDTRFSSGVVLSLEPSGKRFVVNTAAGPLTCDLDPASRIIGADGKPTTPASLRVGGALRLYFVVGQGAHIQEVDLIATQ